MTGQLSKNQRSDNARISKAQSWTCKPHGYRRAVSGTRVRLDSNY
jgi:hypothetical protein